MGAAPGTSIGINGPQAIEQSAGTNFHLNGIDYTVFTVTSYSFANNESFVIHGDGTRRPVVFNSASTAINFKGLMSLTGGLTADQVLFNVTTSGKNVNLADKASFQGTILAPNADKLEMGKATLVGRFFGSFNGTADATIHSEASIAAYDSTGGATNGVPEPSSVALLVVALAGLAAMRRRQTSEPRLAPRLAPIG